MDSAPKKIFLSHSSKDRQLADKLADLLSLGCAIDPNEILVCSLEGKGIPAGTPSFVEYLRASIQNPKLVILLLSENYFATPFCLCELGAAWGMELPTLPLVVPPLTKTNLKVTLAVTQAGEILDKHYLDELRDVVKSRLGSSVPTATWNVKRDVFLNALPALLKLLPEPAIVPRAALDEARQQYAAALTEIAAVEERERILGAQVAELKQCKDAVEVRAITRKYSSTDDAFNSLCEEAKLQLTRLKWATRVALFWQTRGDIYFPDTKEAWEEVNEADAVREVWKEGNACHPNTNEPRVERAEKRVRDIKNFLRDLKDEAFLEEFETENDFTADVSNKDFWKKFLVAV